MTTISLRLHHSSPLHTDTQARSHPAAHWDTSTQVHLRSVVMQLDICGLTVYLLLSSVISAKPKMRGCGETSDPRISGRDEEAKPAIVALSNSTSSFSNSFVPGLCSASPAPPITAARYLCCTVLPSPHEALHPTPSSTNNSDQPSPRITLPLAPTHRCPFTNGVACL